MTEESTEVCVDICEIPSENKSKDSPLKLEILQKTTHLHNILPFLSFAEVDNLRMTNHTIYDSVMTSIDWRARSSELFYPCGFNRGEKKDWTVDQQIENYKNQKQIAEVVYKAHTSFRPLFHKAKSRAQSIFILYISLLLLSLLFLTIHIFHSYLSVHYGFLWSDFFIPYFLIAHIFTLFLLLGLTYHISSTITAYEIYDAFYYHMGYALYLPYYLHSALQLFPHVFLLLVMYTVGCFFWYLSFVGYMHPGTASWVYIFVCSCCSFANDRMRRYIKSVKATKSGQDASTWVRIEKRVIDFTEMIDICLGIISIYQFLMGFHPSVLGLIILLIPDCLIIVLLYKDHENFVSYFTLLLFLIPHAVYVILYYITYIWMKPLWGWISLPLCVYMIGLIALAVYFFRQQYFKYRTIAKNKQFIHYVTLIVNRISEDAFIRAYKDELGLDIDEDVDYSNATEYLFERTVRKVLIGWDAEEEANESSSEIASDFTSSSESASTQSTEDSSENASTQSTEDFSTDEMEEELLRELEELINDREHEERMQAIEQLLQVQEQIAILESHRDFLIQQRNQLQQQEASETNVQIIESDEERFSVD